jgi:hypothetical protein
MKKWSAALNGEGRKYSTLPQCRGKQIPDLAALVDAPFAPEVSAAGSAGPSLSPPPEPRRLAVTNEVLQCQALRL